MIWLGLILLMTFYAAACLTRWRYARHYEPGFRLINRRDFKEAWSYLQLEKRRWRSIIVVWVIVGVTCLLIGLIRNLIQ